MLNKIFIGKIRFKIFLIKKYVDFLSQLYRIQAVTLLSFSGEIFDE